MKNEKDSLNKLGKDYDTSSDMIKNSITKIGSKKIDLTRTYRFNEVGFREEYLLFGLRSCWVFGVSLHFEMKNCYTCYYKLFIFIEKVSREIVLLFLLLYYVLTL